MSALEEETVDWGDVEAATGENKAEDATSGDDVISLGGAEDLEEEVVVAVPAEVVTPVETVSSNGKGTEESIIAAVDAGPAKPLPSGWKLQEARSGGVYYFNTVTGQTTWDFPVETDTSVETAKATPAAEKLGGIQIRGAARSNGSADRKEEDQEQSSKKREADSSAKGDLEEQDNQKRRRSNTPEKKKRETWSKTPEPASKPQGRIQGRGGREEDDRGQKTAPALQIGNGAGWGRRADIASESRAPSGPSAGRSRYDNEPRGGRDSVPTGPRTQEGGNDHRRRPEETQGRDRNDHRGFEGNARSTNDYSQPRPGRNESNRPTNRYDNDRNAPRNEGNRGYERKREASPPPRGRDEPIREREVARERRDQPVDRDSRGPNREPRRVYERDNASSKPRDGDRRSEARASAEPSRSARGVDVADRDTRSSGLKGPQDNAGYKSAGYQNKGYGNQGYSNQGNNYNNGQRQGRPPFPPADLAGPQQGYGQRSQSYQGYRPQGFRPDQMGGYDAARPHNNPQSPGYNKWGQQPYQQGGARPLRPFVPPEEKQKKWWNKNSGEKKPVDAEAFAEAESRDPHTSFRKLSSTPSAEPAPRRTDREIELAEREAAIARKERELGLK